MIGTITLASSGALRPSGDANDEETATDRRYSSHRYVDVAALRNIIERHRRKPLPARGKTLNRLSFGERKSIQKRSNLDTRTWVTVSQPVSLIENESTPEGTRTPNLLIRSQTLYPIELRVRCGKRVGRESPVCGRVSRNSMRLLEKGGEMREMGGNIADCVERVSRHGCRRWSCNHRIR
ncbi:MAG: hypothetical protein RLZZ282_596 [Verrucomicrobiota bacterium]